MSKRLDFVVLASSPQANIRQLCRRFGVSPTTAYKWLGRSRQGGPEALADLSRRPHHSPLRTVVEIEQAVVELRLGGRRIHVSEGVAGQPVGLRPTTTDGLWDVFFCHQKLDQIDLSGNAV